MPNTITSVAVVRAAGLSGWTIEVTYSDGRTPLDLDCQSRTWQGGLALARHHYPRVPCKVDADPYWTKRRRRVVFDANGRSSFAN